MQQAQHLSWHANQWTNKANNVAHKSFAIVLKLKFIQKVSNSLNYLVDSKTKVCLLLANFNELP